MSVNTLKGIHYASGQAIEVRIENGVIRALAPLQGEEAEQAKAKQVIIAPGLVDLQINGFKGMDYNTLPLADGMVSEVTEALFREGVTSYFPTVITNSPTAIEQAVRSIVTEAEQNEIVAKAIQGIHVEGPFISPEDGPRGAHDQAYVQAPDWEMFCEWQAAAQGKIKLITVSPEWPEAPDFISKCAKSGVIVSIGHTAASPEQIQEAVAAGARLSTHFGNGAHLMLPRHPNYLWEQLAQDELWTCLIGDGFHLPESVLKVAMAVKKEKAILVSDAVYLAGMAPGEYETHIGGKVVLAESGKLHLADNSKILAGSAQMLLWGIERLMQAGVTNFAEAWEMSSIRPAKLMGLSMQAGLNIGAPADLVRLKNEAGKLNLLETYKMGSLVVQNVEP